MPRNLNFHRITLIAALVAVFGSLAIQPSQAGPSIYPDGTTRYDKARAYDVDVLFTSGDNVARLIDLNGKVLHQWNDAGSYSSFLDPARAGGPGHVLVTLETAQGSGTDLVPGRISDRISKTIAELEIGRASCRERV